MRGGPNWSPDGRSIAWSDYDGDQVDVVIANLDTHQARAVAATDDDEGFDAWSPDGTKLAFERDHSEVTYPGPQDGIWVVNTDGSNPRQLRHSGRVMDWSPDGKRLLFVDWDAAANNYELYTMRPDGGRVKRLTSNPLDDGWASYSPDGKKIAFSRGQGGHEDDIYVMGADGKGEKRLTTAPGEDLFPQWSPDGKKILFRSRRSGPSAGLYTMRADGSHERYLGQEGWNAAWQPIPR
jgi:TolB protein